MADDAPLRDDRQRRRRQEDGVRTSSLRPTWTHEPKEADGEEDPCNRRHGRAGRRSSGHSRASHSPQLAAYQTWTGAADSFGGTVLSSRLTPRCSTLENRDPGDREPVATQPMREVDEVHVGVGTSPDDRLELDRSRSARLQCPPEYRSDGTGDGDLVPGGLLAAGGAHSVSSSLSACPTTGTRRTSTTSSP